MDDITFRQEVALAVAETIKDVTGFPNITASEKSLAPLLIDRICAAHDREMERIAKGLPEVRKDSQWSYIAKEQHLADQDHILAERAGK